MSETIFYRFVVKRDTAAAFTAANTLLLQGEWALELDTDRMKMGDGVTVWSALPYVLSGPIDLTGLSTGHVIKWNGTQWVVAAEGGGGGGAPSESIIASEALAAGDIVNIWSDAGVAKVRKAGATAQGKEAHGFVLSAAGIAAAATVYFAGKNTALAGLTPGAPLFLSTTPGGVSATAPSAIGNVYQSIGDAYSATGMHFAKQDPITITG